MQPTPQVTPQDVLRVARRDFPSTPEDEIRAILEEYGKESFHREIDRVRLAAMKLASGDVRRLKLQIDGATQDYRDILAAAEYPRYDKMMFRIDRLSEADKNKIIESDWNQYQTWLKKE